VTKTTIEMLMPFNTITADNGREFESHEQISVALDADIYFFIYKAIGDEVQTKTRIVF
jgi:IS30 family transposase